MRSSSSKTEKVVRQGNVDDIRYESGESIDQLFRQNLKPKQRRLCFLNLVRYEFKMSIMVSGTLRCCTCNFSLIGAFISSLSQSYNPNNAAYSSSF